MPMAIVTNWRMMTNKAMEVPSCTTHPNNDDDNDNNDGEGSTLLLHSSRRDCSGNVQQSVRALGIAMMIMVIIMI